MTGGDIDDRALEAWLERAPGRQLRGAELTLLDDTLPGLFGYYVLQLGFWGPDGRLLAGSRSLGRYTVQTAPGGDLRARLDALPLQSESVDTVVLPHSLELVDDPRVMLREVDRILVPEGHVVILGFNPYSLWGMARLARRRKGTPLWSGRFLAEGRLRDWLGLLGYDIVRVRHYFYRPPLKRARALARARFLEGLGARLWPGLSAGYLIVARKRVCTLTPIAPLRRSRRRVRAPALAGNAPGRVAG